MYFIKYCIWKAEKLFVQNNCRCIHCSHCMADWDQQLTATDRHHERASLHVSSLRKDQNSKFQVWLLLNVYHFCSIIRLKGMMLKLKLQYFGYLMQRVDSLEKTLMLGEIGGGGQGDDRGWDGWMASLTQRTLSLSELREMVMDREAWRAAIHGVARSWTGLRDWTELNWTELNILYTNGLPWWLRS